jgi:hypothetical protein
MIDLVPEWEPEWATVQFILFMLAPLFWAGWRRYLAAKPAVTKFSPKPSQPPTVISNITSHPQASWIAGLIGCCWLALAVTQMWARTGPLAGLPPAYHDEYSYRFEARLIADGRWTIPSPPVMPELFNQMHVLNEGRMASRYYPGTAFWLAPFERLGDIHRGPLVAQILITMLAFAIGFQLGGQRCGWIAGAMTAVSPGLVIFCQLLLAHHPTLVGLALFLVSIIPLIKYFNAIKPSIETLPATWKLYTLASLSTTGLAFAMICRPATAFAIGLPFGAYLVWKLIRTGITLNSKTKLIAAFGWPLIVGWIIMLAYNASVTSSIWQSPYQLYTEIYTPRHVFGFDNATRGAQSTSPKILAAYDRWATNLTPALALQNVFTRLLGSWIWSFDPLVTLITAIGSLWLAYRQLIWRLLLLCIVALHAIHFPYWYAGIMGWHYVFESSLLWILLFGGLATSLMNAWTITGRPLATRWLCAVLFIAVIAAHLPAPLGGDSKPGAPTEGRFGRALASLRYPMLQFAQFESWLQTAPIERPALLLFPSEQANFQLDFVDNHPRSLTAPEAPILRARYDNTLHTLEQISTSFPDYNVYLIDPFTPRIIKSLPSKSAPISK